MQVKFLVNTLKSLKAIIKKILPLFFHIYDNIATKSDSKNGCMTLFIRLNS